MGIQNRGSNPCRGAKPFESDNYAALNMKTSAVEGKTAHRHISAEFVDFLSRLVKKARWAREIHIVLDNLFRPQNTRSPRIPET